MSFAAISRQKKRGRCGMIPNFRDKRAVKLPNVKPPGFIPLFAGRPEREKIINRDDGLDLKILLNTSKTVDEFLAKL